MKMNYNFDDILNECLDRIIKGETIESCLAKYPEQANELKPLLLTARSARAMSNIQPRPEFKTKARSEFQAAVRDIQAKKSKRPSGFSWNRSWQSAWSFSLAVIALLVIAGSGTVIAARNTLPDDALYSVKIATENVQLAVTSSEIRKAELNAKFADIRVDEIIEMTTTGDSQEVLAAANNLSVNMSNMAVLAGGGVSGDNYNDSASALGGNEGAAGTGSGGNGPALMFGVEDKRADNGTGIPVPASAPFAAPVPVTTPENSAGVYFPPIIGEDNTTQMTVYPGVTTDSARHKSDIKEPDAQPEIVQSNTQNLSASSNAKISELEKIREIIASSYFARQARLEEAYNNASPDMKPAILEAINQSTLEFEKALFNNDLALNSQ
jgi:hypothetical protein